MKTTNKINIIACTLVFMAILVSFNKFKPESSMARFLTMVIASFLVFLYGTYKERLKWENKVK